MTWQHQRSYQGRYWLVTVRINGDIIVLPHWGIKPPAPWPDIALSHITLTLIEPVLALSLLMPSTRLESVNHQLYKSFVWLDQEPNFRYPACEARALPAGSPRPEPSMDECALLILKDKVLIAEMAILSDPKWPPYWYSVQWSARNILNWRVRSGIKRWRHHPENGHGICFKMVAKLLFLSVGSEENLKSENVIFWS